LSFFPGANWYVNASFSAQKATLKLTQKRKQPVAVLSRDRGAQPPSPVLLQAPNFVATRNFLAKLTQISDFFAFPNCRKVGIFAASIERPKTKSASASGGLCLLTS